MNIYTVSCHSDCGSYFVVYLQSVTVIASSEEHAKTLVKEWMTETGNTFLYEETKWNIILEREGLEPGVIKWHSNSDY